MHSDADGVGAPQAGRRRHREWGTPVNTGSDGWKIDGLCCLADNNISGGGGAGGIVAGSGISSRHRISPGGQTRGAEHSHAGGVQRTRAKCSRAAIEGHSSAGCARSGGHGCGQWGAGSRRGAAWRSQRRSSRGRSHRQGSIHRRDRVIGAVGAGRCGHDRISTDVAGRRGGGGEGFRKRVPAGRARDGSSKDGVRRAEGARRIAGRHGEYRRRCDRQGAGLDRHLVVCSGCTRHGCCNRISARGRCRSGRCAVSDVDCSAHRITADESGHRPGECRESSSRFAARIGNRHRQWLFEQAIHQQCASAIAGAVRAKCSHEDFAIGDGGRHILGERAHFIPGIVGLVGPQQLQRVRVVRIHHTLHGIVHRIAVVGRRRPDDAVRFPVSGNRKEPAGHGPVIVGHWRRDVTHSEGRGVDRAVVRETPEYVVLSPIEERGTVGIAVEVHQATVDVAGPFAVDRLKLLLHLVAGATELAHVGGVDKVEHTLFTTTHHVIGVRD